MKQLKTIKITWTIILSLVLPVWICLNSLAVASELFIAPNGNDDWDGSIEKPLATLEAARNKVRLLRPNRTINDPIIIKIRGGDYHLTKALTLNEEDSGFPQQPIVWEAYNNEHVRVTGSQQLTGFQLVEASEILNKLPVEARNHVVSAELGRLSIDHVGELTARGFLHTSTSALELFIGSKPMPLARYPNTGWLTIKDLPQGEQGGSFTVASDRLIRWVNAQDPWVYGYWNVDWADQFLPVKSVNMADNSISVSVKHEYGFRAGQRFYIQNLLEELDTPGEWYLDRKTKILYLYPPENIESSEIAVSVLEESFIEMNNVSNIIFRGINFDIARADGIRMIGGNHINITDCTISNIGGSGIVAYGGAEHSITHNEIFNTARGGISIGGGSRAELKAANHTVVSNHIHDYARVERTYNAAIDIDGVGINTYNNKIHDAPHLAIKINGNEHNIEYNEIYHVMLETDDAGAIYMGRDWTQRGHMIRYNYIHHSGPEYAPSSSASFSDVGNNVLPGNAHGAILIYLDDMASGVTIAGNVLHGGDKAVLVGGGRDNEITNNILLEGKVGVEIDARGLTWASDRAAIGGEWQIYEKLLAMNYRQPPFSTAYPKLAAIFDNNPYAPMGNFVVKNIFIHNAEPLKLGDRVDIRILDLRENINIPELQVTDDPISVAQQISLNFANSEKFQAIPFGQIGLMSRSPQ